MKGKGEGVGYFASHIRQRLCIPFQPGRKNGFKLDRDRQGLGVFWNRHLRPLKVPSIYFPGFKTNK
jgi:hypothetical protein